jgi:hypothetical protein
LGSDITCIPSQSIEFRALIGDINSDGLVYVVGNVFHHINSNGLTGSGQAVYIGRQVQARIVNNTIYKCLQGVPEEPAGIRPRGHGAGPAAPSRSGRTRPGAWITGRGGRRRALPESKLALGRRFS